VAFEYPVSEHLPCSGASKRGLARPARRGGSSSKADYILRVIVVALALLTYFEFIPPKRPSFDGVGSAGSVAGVLAAVSSSLSMPNIFLASSAVISKVDPAADVPEIRNTLDATGNAAHPKPPAVAVIPPRDSGHSAGSILNEPVTRYALHII
jgi:hypothetical protein